MIPARSCINDRHTETTFKMSGSVPLPIRLCTRAGSESRLAGFRKGSPSIKKPLAASSQDFGDIDGIEGGIEVMPRAHLN